jgi:hypothetical protein
LLSNGKGSFFLLVSVFLFLSLWLSCSLTFTFLPGLLIILCFFTHLLYYLLATFSTTFFLLRYGMQGCGSVRRMEVRAGAGLGWVGLGRDREVWGGTAEKGCVVMKANNARRYE